MARPELSGCGEDGIRQMNVENMGWRLLIIPTSDICQQGAPLIWFKPSFHSNSSFLHSEHEIIPQFLENDPYVIRALENLFPVV